MPVFRSSMLLIGGVVMVGCASAPPHKAGDEYLKAINVEGNKALKDKTITTGLWLKRTMKRGRAPDPYAIETDAERIKGEYVRHGYLDVDVRSRVERSGDGSTVIYTIDEGVRAKTKVMVTGIAQAELVAKIKHTLPLKDGSWFDYETYDEAKDALQVVVADAGYAHAKFTPQVRADRATNTAFVSLAYDPGPVCTFGQVEIEGVDGQLREAVEARLQFQQGQQYSASAIAQTQRKLYGFSRFSTVRVVPDLNDIPDEVVGVKVAVSQGARHEVKFGGGFGVDPSAYEVRGRAGYSIAGWPFPLQTFAVDLRPAYAKLRNGGGYEPRIKAVASLERQDFLWTYAKGLIEGAYDYLSYEAYTTYGPRARLGFSTPIFSDRFQLRLGWGIQQASFSKPNELITDEIQARIHIDEPELITAFNQTLILDLRDNFVEPTSGAYAELRVSEGTPFAGSNFSYYEVMPEVRGYVPLGSLVLAAQARVGGIFGKIPPTERLFSGGATSQRGFSDRKLAPSAIGEVNGSIKSIPYGGGGLVDTSVELRIPITTIKEMPLGAVTFLDGGDVTETPSDIVLGNLHWAAGLGLRLLTIIGPVRIDFGYRLNRTGGMNPDPESTWAFHFGIGEAF